MRFMPAVVSGMMVPNTAPSQTSTGLAHLLDQLVRLIDTIVDAVGEIDVLRWIESVTLAF